MKKILVIGCGGAGMFSAILATQLRPKKFKASILSDEKDIFCRCSSPYILKGRAEMRDAIQPDSMIEDYGVELIKEKAISIDTTKKAVISDKNNFYQYDYLVIASGARARKLKIQGLKENDFYSIRTSDDVRSINKDIEGKQSAVVVGAGIIGMEMAAALREKGLEVTILERNDRISEDLADLEYSMKLVELLRDFRINIVFSSEIEKVGRVKNKKIINFKKKGELRKIETDLIIMATGVEPNTDIAKAAGVEINKSGIVVDDKMKTNLKNVYACGDCASPLSAVTGQNSSSKLASAAIAQAKIVGYQIAGFPIKYPGTTNAFAFKILGREYGQVGLNEKQARKKFHLVVYGEAESNDKYKDLKDARPLKMKLIFAGPRLKLVGAEAFGNGCVGFLEVCSLAIGQKMSLLKLMRYNYIAHPSLSPWPFMNPIVMACENAMEKIMKFFGKK